MTKIIQDMTVYTYNEWFKLPAVQEMYGKLKDCPTCDGEGEHECECGDTHDCNACGGSGKEKDNREIYEHLLREEIKSLHGWIDGAPLKTLYLESMPHIIRPVIPVALMIRDKNL